MADMPEQRNPADRSGHIGGIGEGGKLIAEERTADNGGRGNTGIKAEAGANPHDGKADVPIVPHEVPVVSDVTEHRIRLVTRNRLGEMIWRPT